MNDHKTLKIIVAVIVGLVLLTGSFSGGLLVGWLLPDKTAIESPVTTSEPTQSCHNSDSRKFRPIVYTILGSLEPGA